MYESNNLNSARLKQAIENQDIFLVYQPIILLESLQIVAYEALARWSFEGKFISPEVFTGLGELEVMRSLTQYIFGLAENQQKKIGLPVHVNITLWDLSMKFLSKVSCLEITESCLITNNETIKQINKLAQNYEIVIDDFGKDYASWNTLPYLNIKKLKLDKKITSELLLSHASWYESIIRFIVQKANEDNITVIAEGIEHKEQLEVLKAIGVHQGQGWLFGHPIRLT